MYIYSHFKISTQTNISDKNAIKLLRPKSLSCHNLHTPALQLWCRQATDLFQCEIITNFRNGVLLLYDGIQGKCKSSGRVLFPRRNKYRTFTKEEFKSSRLFGVCDGLSLCQRTLIKK